MVGNSGTIEQAIRVLAERSIDADRAFSRMTPESPRFPFVCRQIAARALSAHVRNFTADERSLILRFVTVDSQDEVNSFLSLLKETDRAELQ
jgi:hypothetical protein